MTYVKANVNKPSTLAPGKGGNKKDLVAFFDWDDILTPAARDEAGILIEGSHVFKANKYAVKIYATPNSIANKSNSEGEIDSEGILQEVVFSHPGSSQEIREFRQNWLNRNIGIVVFKCDGSDADQYGSHCAPLRMSFEAPDDSEQNKSTFTFSSSNKGPDVAIYQGTLTFATPVDTLAADAVEVDLTAGEGEYQLTDGSVSAVEITTATNAVHGMIFTLLGSGGDNPSTISDANDFVLKNGNTWTALSGSQITFKAYKDGAASWKFFELSRS